MRTTGRVKWFDAATGEGCVVSESGCQAALHRATLEAFGLDAVAPGAAIAYEVQLASEGLTVTAIHAVDGERPRAKGAVKLFDHTGSTKGGARAPRPRARDIVLNKVVVDDPDCIVVLQGATVECDVIEKVKGLQARR